MAPDEITETALITVSSWQRKGIKMPDFDIEDEIALKSLRQELPPVAYPEKGSLLHLVLLELKWIEDHEITADSIFFVKMINPDGRK